MRPAREGRENASVAVERRMDADDASMRPAREGRENFADAAMMETGQWPLQ